MIEEVPLIWCSKCNSLKPKSGHNKYWCSECVTKYNKQKYQEKKKLKKPMINNSDQLLTKKETAKMLRVTEKTVDDYRRRGLLQANKVGRKVLFFESKVLESIKPA